MGLYIHTGNAGFVRARNSEYIDDRKKHVTCKM